MQTPLREMQISSGTKTESFSARALWWRSVRAVFVKDWRGEWRTRAALNSIALFAIAVPIALSFSVAAQKLTPSVQAGLLWTTLLLAALIGLSRAWIKEEESGTHWLLRLHAPASAVLWGKTLWNLSLLLLTQLGAVPVTIVLLDIHVAQPLLLFGVLALADIGFGGGFVVVGRDDDGRAIARRAVLRHRGTNSVAAFSDRGQRYRRGFWRWWRCQEQRAGFGGL